MTDWNKIEQEMRKELDENRPKALIEFMCAVAKEFNCLPCFADPSPNGGNAHIMEKIR